MSTPSNRCPIFLDSIPKAGAHLAVKALELMEVRLGSRSIGSASLFGRAQLFKTLSRGAWGTGDVVVVGIEVPTPVRASWVRRRLAPVGPGEFLRGHVRHSEYFAHLLGERGFRCLHVVRDPRDVAVSHAHYLMDRKRHPFHRFYWELGDWSRRLAFSITGGWVPGLGYQVSLAERYRSMEGWERFPGTVTVRFEELVGSQGGGSEDVQRRAVAEIAEIAGVENPEEATERVVESLFGGTSTFRKGRIGGWQEAFGPEHRELLAPGWEETFGRWGYTLDGSPVSR